MPIEDINYLLAHGHKENKIIFIDSSQRDRSAWPRSSQYAFEFAEPFTNVYSVDILDAAIPRTMYNVDIYNNTIVFGIGLTPTVMDQKITLRSMDYTLPSIMSGITSAGTNLKGTFSLTASSYGDGTAIVVYTCNVPFVFDMRASTLRECLGFTEYADAQEKVRYVKIQDTSTSDLSLMNQQLFGSVSKTSLPDLYIMGEFYSGAITASHNFKINARTQIAQALTVNIYSFLHQISVQLIAVGGYSVATATPALTWTIVNTSTRGNYPSNVESDVLARGTLTLNKVSMIATSDILSNDDFNLVHISSLNEYWIVIQDTANLSDTAYLGVLYNTVHSPLDIPGSVITNPTYGIGSWTDPAISPAAAFCIYAYTVNKVFTVTSPGIISLVGDRFITLRCPEVEQFIYGSAAYGYNSPGLALFKLGNVGYADARFDFSSTSVKEFHPIGKLSKLTFQFERLTREIYDFKGVNHHLLVAIRYLTAGRPVDFTRYTLNPNYEPNFMKYLRVMEEKEGDSDDGSEIDELTFRNEYVKKEEEYDFEEQDEIDYLPSLDPASRLAWENELRR